MLHVWFFNDGKKSMESAWQAHGEKIQRSHSEASLFSHRDVGDVGWIFVTFGDSAGFIDRIYRSQILF